jgi:hypothetical protein
VRLDAVQVLVPHTRQAGSAMGKRM